MTQGTGQPWRDPIRCASSASPSAPSIAAVPARRRDPRRRHHRGTDDEPVDPEHPNVGLLFFYQSDGRFRCTGTLIHPRVLLTAAHCTFGDIGKVAVTFDTQVAQDAAAGRSVLPRAEDDLGLGLEGSGYDARAVDRASTTPTATRCRTSARPTRTTCSTHPTTTPAGPTAPRTGARSGSPARR